MDIIATNAEYFDKLEASTMGEPQRIGPELIKERLEAIDEALFAGRPRWLLPERVDRRRILTLAGYVDFRRRYYWDGRGKRYTYLLDAAIGIPKNAKLSNGFRLRLAEAASDMTYSKAGRWSPFWEAGTVSRSRSTIRRPR